MGSKAPIVNPSVKIVLAILTSFPPETGTLLSAMQTFPLIGEGGTRSVTEGAKSLA